MLLVCAVGAAVSVPRISHAQVTGPHGTVTGYLGGTNWDNKVNLNGGMLFGGRLGFMANEYFGIEGSFERSNTTTRSGLTPWTVPGTPAGSEGADYSAERGQISLIAQLMPHAKLSPYLVGGYSRTTFDSHLSNTFDEGDKGYDVGAGVMVRAMPRLNARIEARNFGFRFHAANPWGDQMNNNIVYSLGVQYSVGGRIWTPPAAVAPTVTNVTNVTNVLPAEVPPPPAPKVDTDHDGVTDDVDLCPNTPPNARVDKDGCPIEVTDMERQVLETGLIVLHNVNFEFDKAELLPEAGPVLDQVGATLIQWPELRIEIGGHTDSKGTNEYNHDLSHRRADAVLAYLLAHFPQINRSQWTTMGYGEEKPLATNATEEGMAMNRRVEFKVLNNESLQKVRERRHILYKGGGN